VNRTIRVRIVAQVPRLLIVDTLLPDGGIDSCELLTLNDDELDDAIEALQAAKKEPRADRCIYVVSKDRKVIVDRE
jgi:hypothetical protein